MDFTQLKELLRLVNDSELREFELDTHQLAVRMSKNDMAAFSPRTSEQETPSAPAPVPAHTSVQVKETAETPAADIPEQEAEEQGHILEAPIVGTVYLSPSPDKPAFKKVGDPVKEGEPLCIIEAMKVMNEIKSDKDGILQEVLVEDEQPIEYGQPLFRITEEGQ